MRCENSSKSTKNARQRQRCMYSSESACFSLICCFRGCPYTYVVRNRPQTSEYLQTITCRRGIAMLDSDSGGFSICRTRFTDACTSTSATSTSATIQSATTPTKRIDAYRQSPRRSESPRRMFEKGKNGMYDVLAFIDSDHII